MPEAETILIIDDEPNLRSTLAAILHRAGYQVVTAANAYEALRQMASVPFDLVFLDLKMPEVDGLTLLPDIRKQDPDLPVLILTAHATLDTAIDAVRKGARDYLLKPIDPSLIISRVKEILAESRQPRRQRQIIGKIQGLLAELDGEEESQDAPAVRAKSQTKTINQEHILVRGAFNLDLHTRRVVVNNRNILLSPTAFAYLVTLIRHSPDAVPFGTLVYESQGYKTSALEAQEMARSRIHEIRKAVEPDPHCPTYIITVRGVGYRLVI